MAVSDSVLRNKNVAVVGYNARPIACSAKRQNSFVYVSDFWGDSDLDACSFEWVSVMSPTTGGFQKEGRDIPIHQSLAQNLVDSFRNAEMDYVLIGSGFDDHPESMAILEKEWAITGNSSRLMSDARDTKHLARLAEELDIEYPIRHIVNTPEQALQKCNDIELPCVIRPVHSGGGAGIHFVRTIETVQSAYERVASYGKDGAVVVQQYISGLDVSASVLSTGDSAMTLSIQGQLIGIPSVAVRCGFAYCGNYCPVTISSEVSDKIAKACETICTDLGLLGSNGVDLIVGHGDHVWLMEVNPRLQGTLELIERASDVSVTELHTRASKGTLPDSPPKIHPAAKVIVYAKRTGTCPDLSQFPNTVDRTPAGVSVERGAPICTVIETRESAKLAYQAACRTAKQILLSMNCVSQS